MHIIFPIIIQLYFLPAILAPHMTASVDEVREDKVIEITVMNQDMIAFDFSMKYAPVRKQIQIRSAKAIQSLRIMDSNKQNKSYDVRGSSLIMLPKSDFMPGQYMAEIKFQKDPAVILAKVKVYETLKPSDL